MRKFRRLSRLKQIEIAGYLNGIAFLLNIIVMDPNIFIQWFFIVLTTFTTTACAMMYEDELKLSYIDGLKSFNTYTQKSSVDMLKG